MNTKESINFMEIFLEDSNAYYNGKYEFGIKEVIKRLKENEKYKQIVEDVRQYIIDRQTIEEDFCTNGNEIIDLINWLKRKNFPEDRPIKEERMDYMEKGATIGKPRTVEKKTKLDKAIKKARDMRIADEKEENEKKYDKWFKNLSDRRQAFIAYNFWDNASYEDKKEEYELE